MSTEQEHDAEKPEGEDRSLDRRRFVALCGTLGVGGVALPQLLAAATPAKPGTITRQDLSAVEDLTGLHFSDPQRELMQKGLAEQRQGYGRLRGVVLDNSVPPAFRFDPAPPTIVPETSATSGASSAGERRPFRVSAAGTPAEAPEVPANLEDLAFLPITHLGRLVQSGKVRSVDLTRMYLARLRRLDPVLHAVITYTEERALEKAEAADREIAGGRVRGPLHGIPWGAKDLLAVRGYPTTWGSVPYKDQVIPEDATVVERLDRAGAVLVAKLAVGELAWGDVWFGGMTRNPWKPEQGSSGSSAGSAATTAAGAVGFAIGTETLGSIVSPSTRCGATGLRPTFGRVSRHGAMALAWSMDKIGTICRSVEDCAAVFDAIHGADGKDETAVDRPFVWNPDLDVKRLRVGYVKALFDAKPEKDREETHALDLAVLDALRGLGVALQPIDLPELPDSAISALRIILTAEGAAAFDELTRSGRDDLMVRHKEENAWPNVFRQGRTIPAVEYIQANRVRTLLMRQMAQRMATVDAYVAPSFGGDNVLITNLTGHPAVVLPNGFRQDGTPASITFTGRLYGEAELLALARAYQDATGFHLKHPKL
ncbi:MAG TPA: amidase [Thermoanaerobaculia bacterium]|nr:amidase [Thermoanaerobaculia bacterium]